jgi:hypothetical protein
VNDYFWGSAILHTKFRKLFKSNPIGVISSLRSETELKNMFFPKLGKLAEKEKLENLKEELEELEELKHPVGENKLTDEQIKDNKRIENQNKNKEEKNKKRLEARNKRIGEENISTQKENISIKEKNELIRKENELIRKENELIRNENKPIKERNEPIEKRNAAKDYQYKILDNKLEYYFKPVEKIASALQTGRLTVGELVELGELLKLEKKPSTESVDSVSNTLKQDVTEKMLKNVSETLAKEWKPVIAEELSKALFIAEALRQVVEGVDYKTLKVDTKTLELLNDWKKEITEALRRVVDSAAKNPDYKKLVEATLRLVVNNAAKNVYFKEEEEAVTKEKNQKLKTLAEAAEKNEGIKDTFTSGLKKVVENEVKDADYKILLEAALGKVVKNDARDIDYQTLAEAVKKNEKVKDIVIYFDYKSSKKLLKLSESTKKKLFPLHQSESGYSDANVLKVMYKKPDARTAVQALYMVKKINSLMETASRKRKKWKKKNAHKSEEKQNKNDPAYWMSGLDYILDNWLIKPYFKLFAKSEWSSENIMAYDVFVKWKIKRKTTKPEIEEFLEKFCGSSAEFEINVAKADIDGVKKRLTQVNDNTKNLWEDKDFRTYFDQISGTVMTNLADTFSRLRYFKAAYNLLKKDDEPTRKLKTLITTNMVYLAPLPGF